LFQQQQRFMALPQQLDHALMLAGHCNHGDARAYSRSRVTGNAVAMGAAPARGLIRSMGPAVGMPRITGFTVGAQIDEPGTAFYVVVADGAAAPSATQVRAGQDATGGVALGTGTIALAAADPHARSAACVCDILIGACTCHRRRLACILARDSVLSP